MYAAMHEPDGVRGVNALRKEEPSLREQILEHESIGLLRESTACYDRAIQLEPDQVRTTHSYSYGYQIQVSVCFQCPNRPSAIVRKLHCNTNDMCELCISTLNNLAN